jgi:pilus assembly protein CpaC
LPLVLGNGNIRLEVRPRISDLDAAAGIQLEDIEVPGFRVRQIDTAVEMKAGQTFALAGLVQEKTFTLNRGVPYLSDLPIIGVPFRRTLDDVEEIELLIMVTPEFIDPIDACEAPCGGPGYATVSPTNRQLYCAGHVEVPPHCNPIQGLQACGQDPCGPCSTCAPSGNGAPHGEPLPMITDGVSMPGGTGYDDSTIISDEQQDGSSPSGPGSMPAPQPPRHLPDDLQLPDDANEAAPDSVYYQPGSTQSVPPAGSYTPPRRPVFMRNASRPHNPQPAAMQPAIPAGQSGLYGPVGYDLQ